MYTVRATYSEKVAQTSTPFARDWQFEEKEQALSFAVVLQSGENSLITNVEVLETSVRHDRSRWKPVCGCQLDEHDFTCARNLA